MNLVTGKQANTTTVTNAEALPHHSPMPEHMIFGLKHDTDLPIMIVYPRVHNDIRFALPTKVRRHDALIKEVQRCEAEGKHVQHFH